jgi:anti-sigma factor RsiW
VDRSLHESDDQLELYALDRLSDTEVERVEEHLLICENCRKRLEEAGMFARTMQYALSNPVVEPMPRRKSWFEGWHLRFALGGAIAVALVLAVVAYRAGKTSLPPVATLTLSPLRGSAANVSPAETLDLTLSTGAAGSLTAEVINDSGTLVWQEVSRPENGTVRVRVRKQLPAGTYFARLRAASGETLDEYGFTVRP